MHDEWSQAVNAHAQAADRLAEAALSGKPCAPIRDLVSTAADAYAVQEIGTKRALAEGRRLVGRKIGVTNPLLQQQFGIDQPDFGMLFADMYHRDGLPIPLEPFLQPKAEAEVALVLGADLEGGPFTVADVIRAVDFALRRPSRSPTPGSPTGTSRWPTPSPTTPRPARSCWAARRPRSWGWTCGRPG